MYQPGDTIIVSYEGRVINDRADSLYVVDSSGKSHIYKKGFVDTKMVKQAFNPEPGDLYLVTRNNSSNSAVWLATNQKGELKLVSRSGMFDPDTFRKSYIDSKDFEMKKVTVKE